MERLIVLGFWRDVGLRARLLGTFGLEMPAQRRLALGIVARLELLGHVLQRFDIGRDALGLDRPAGWREVARSGEPQSPIAGAKWNDGLHRSLAEGAGTDDRRASVILQSASHDLGGRSRAAVDQHDEGLAPGEIARVCMEALGLRGDAAAGRDNLALLKERIGDRDRLIEQPAGIVAQIDNEALELIAGLGSEVGDRFFQAIRGLLVELSNANVADIILVHPRSDRAQADEFARNRN